MRTGECYRHRMLQGLPGEFSAVQWNILGVSILKFITVNFLDLDMLRHFQGEDLQDP